MGNPFISHRLLAMIKKLSMKNRLPTRVLVIDLSLIALISSIMDEPAECPKFDTTKAQVVENLLKVFKPLQSKTFKTAILGVHCPTIYIKKKSKTINCIKSRNYGVIGDK